MTRQKAHTSVFFLYTENEINLHVKSIDERLHRTHHPTELFWPFAGILGLSLMDREVDCDRVIMRFRLLNSEFVITNQFCSPPFVSSSVCPLMVGLRRKCGTINKPERRNGERRSRRRARKLVICPPPFLDQRTEIRNPPSRASPID
jgi:hypothetical protein